MSETFELRKGRRSPGQGLVLALVLLIAGCGGNQVSPTPSGAPDSAFLSILDEIQPDGSVSKDTALRAFSLAFGPMPGVDLPAGDRAAPRSGTLALRWLVQHWDELSAEQQTAAIGLVPDLQGITGSSSGLGDSVLSAGFAPVAPRPDRLGFAQQRPNSYYTQLAQDAVAQIGTRLKTPVNIGFAIDAHVGLTDKANSAAETAALDANGTKNGGAMAKCVITISPAGDAYTDQADIDDMMAHEAWHCYEGAVLGLFHYWYTVKAWIEEGEAEWVGYSFAPTARIGPWSWPRYLQNPGSSLFQRAYDAIGFYSQLELSGVDVWAVLVPILQAINDEPAFVAGGATNSSFLDIWASGYLRDLARGDPWQITGPGVTGEKATPTVLAVPNGSHANQSADAYTNKISVIQPTPDVLTVTVSGHGRISDTSGTDEVIAGSQTFCLLPGGCGECPAVNLTGAPIAFALTGGTAGGTATLEGKSKEQFCPQASPSKPCPSGCGGSNGDPHLKTVDGSRYDLQAAGEYVLLRAPDGAVEIQARQEPRGDVATVNSAVAARVNGHRVGFYVQEQDVPEVRIDGAVVAPDAAGSADLGAGATLSSYQRGYELDFPDGTKLWALSLGSWGINVLVLPSDSLRANGGGLLAAVPSNAQFRVPALPDGTLLQPPANRDEHYHLLYEVFAPAWRVTDQTSLFDYDAGKATDSYTVADFPPRTSPFDASEVDPTALANAQPICGGVTEPDLAAQCAFDVAITGENEFATLYLVSDNLETQGTTTLDQPPPSVPGETPPPSQGPLPAGINFVADHLVAVNSRLLGANGVLYVNVSTAAATFGDVAYAMLAVDPASGQVLQRVDANGPGLLAWTAGSVWVGEFARPAIGTCQVSRLDPATLAVQATVPTVCGDRLLTVLGAVGDEVWFVDATGAAADGTGQHLRRINPTTNAIDASPGGSIELPVAVQYVGVLGAGTVWQSTSAGLVLGDRQHGLFRLLAGADAFEPLGVPGIGLEWYAAGDGVWTVTNTGENGGQGSAASFFNGGLQPVLFVGYDGYLAGADDGAVYVEYQLDSDTADSLVRYPTDGSAPATVAFGGTVTNPFGGQTPLGYDDSLVNPLLYGQSLVVKAWQAPTATDETLQQLLVQAISVP